MGRVRASLAWGTVVLLAAGAGFWAGRATFVPPAAHEADAGPTVVRLGSGTVGAALDLTATVTWPQGAPITSPEGGVVTSVTASPEKPVAAGDVLVTLGLRPVIAAVGDVLLSGTSPRGPRAPTCGSCRGCSARGARSPGSSTARSGPGPSRPFGRGRSRSTWSRPASSAPGTSCSPPSCPLGSRSPTGWRWGGRWLRGRISWSRLRRPRPSRSASTRSDDPSCPPPGRRSTST